MVLRAPGETWWGAGEIPGPAEADVVLGVGQTYKVNGWTVRTEELRTEIKNDDAGHGLHVNAVDVGPF